MSSSLIAKPANPPNTLSLSCELKFALRRRFDKPVNIQMNPGHIPYLQGLKDAGVKDADKLIKYIRKKGDVIIKEEF